MINAREDYLSKKITNSNKKDSILADIANLKAVQNALDESEEKYRLLFEKSEDPILLIDGEQWSDCNQAALDFFGFDSKMDLIGLSPADNSPHLQYDETYSNAKAKKMITFAYENGFNRFDWMHVNRRGDVKHVDAMLTAIPYNGKTLLFTLLRDMTEVHRINEEILQQKELFETLVQTSPIATMLINSNFDILFASQLIMQFFSLHEILAVDPLNIINITHPRIHPQLYEALALVQKNKKLFNYQIDIETVNNVELQMEINASLVKNKLKQSDAIIVTLLDISERKQVELAKENALTATLEAVENKHQALELLHNSARLASIGVIAGGIVHEISQPLNAIRIGSEGIISWNSSNGEALPTPIITMLEGISKATNRIDSIVKHMRSIWIDSNQNLQEQVNLNDAVFSAINLAKMRAQSHEIFFELEISPLSLFVMANTIHLELIVNNLITNAIHSLDKIKINNKTIRIITYKDNEYIYLIISDNGVGLPDIDKNKLFDPFFSTRQNEGGTGLGLSIVKMFLQKFNASITPKNNETGGVSFTVRFKQIIPLEICDE